MDKRQICLAIFTHVPEIGAIREVICGFTRPVFMGDPLRNVCMGLQVNSIDGHHSTGFAYRRNAGGVGRYLLSLLTLTS